MYSGDAKIIDLVREHDLQTKERTRIKGGRQKRGVKRKIERRVEQIISIFLIGEV
jgi:hypothetical protein